MNYFRIKEMIMVSAFTIATITETEFNPTLATRWAKVIQDSVATVQYISIDVIVEVLLTAYTCISEETQTYQYMQISDSEMESIINKRL